MLEKLDLYRNEIGRSHTVKDIVCLDNKEPSLAKIRREVSKDVAELYLNESLMKMLNVTGITLSDEQLDYLVEYIFRHYYWLTISDFNVVTDLLFGKKLYGAGKVQDVVDTIVDYERIVRTEASEQYQIEKASQHKEKIILENEQIQAFYERVRAEAREPKISQIEIDNQRKAENEAKIDELKRLYPVSQEDELIDD